MPLHMKVNVTCSQDHPCASSKEALESSELPDMLTNVWHQHVLLAYYARHDKDSGVGADSLCSDGPVMLEGTKQMCLCTVNDWHIALSTIKGSQQAHLLQALWMRSNLTQWPWLHSCHCFLNNTHQAAMTCCMKTSHWRHGTCYG